MRNAIDTYQQDAVLALPRERLLLKIYDVLLLRIDEARRALDAGERAQAGKAISKAFDVVDALRGALDPTTGAQCVGKLDQLYRTVSAWLLEANLTQSSALLDSTRRVIGTLKEGWDGAVQSVSTR